MGAILGSQSGAGIPVHPTGETDMATELTIYHNPNCGTSRKVLGMLRESGVEPRVIEYLKTPPTRAELIQLLASMGMTPRQLLRRKGTPFDELGLDDPAKSDAQLLDAILAHPILMERPVVVTNKGVRVCRPAETVMDLL
jgi:arsenate reductase (glutaredoxin)